MKLFYSYMGRSRSFFFRQWKEIKSKINKIFLPATHGYFALVILGRHFLTILCFMLFGAGISQSQSREIGTANNQTIVPLSIGDSIPDDLWNMPLQVVNHPNGKETITLGEYKDKLIILDFWATWCAPCIKSLNTLDTLQKEFESEVMIIPINYEKRNIVAKTFKDRNWSLLSVFSDTLINRYFPHKVVPHQIIIKNSKVLAITSANEINNKKIANILSGEDEEFKVKREIEFDRFESIISHIDINDKHKSYQSILTGHIDGLSGSGRQNDGTVQELHAFNQPPVFMYRTILNDVYASSIDLDVEEKEWYYKYERGKTENLFCFQLIVPSNLPSKHLRLIALNNLNSFFNLYGRFERRDKECYVLIDKKRGGKKIKIDTLGKTEYNANTFVSLLNFSLVWSPHLNRFLNESSYDGSFWTINPNNIKEFKNDITKLNEFLNNYNLEVVKKIRTVDVFVISKNHDKS